MPTTPATPEAQPDPDYSMLERPDYPFAKQVFQELKALKVPIESLWSAGAPDGEDDFKFADGHTLSIGSLSERWDADISALLSKGRKVIKNWGILSARDAKSVAEFVSKTVAKTRV